MDQVQEKGAHLRSELWHYSARALAAIGEPPTLMTQREAEFRLYLHDALSVDHDMDIVSLAMFPFAALCHLTLHVWIVDYHGTLREYVFVGDSAELANSKAQHAYLLVERNHARAVEPPPFGGAWQPKRIIGCRAGSATLGSVVGC